MTREELLQCLDRHCCAVHLMFRATLTLIGVGWRSAASLSKGSEEVTGRSWDMEPLPCRSQIDTS
jgi:hypothetical protein